MSFEPQQHEATEVEKSDLSYVCLDMKQVYTRLRGIFSASSAMLIAAVVGVCYLGGITSNLMLVGLLSIVVLIGMFLTYTFISHKMIDFMFSRLSTRFI